MPDFGSLDVKVIANDGVLVEAPFVPDRLELAPGNRIDLDVAIPTSAAGRTVDIFDRTMGQPVRLARIEVAGDAVQTPDFDAPRNRSFPDWGGGEQRAGGRRALLARHGPGLSE